MGLNRLNLTQSLISLRVKEEIENINPIYKKKKNRIELHVVDQRGKKNMIKM